MSSALISAEITATCNALGDANKSTKYILGPHCKESAKDLIKYLRRDDETNSIRRQLGDTNIVHTDLIPIIVHFSENEELFDVILRLLVNLTTPAMILYHEELPTDKVERQLYHQIIAHLQKYKIAFANEDFWKILRTKLTSILNIPHAERTEEKSLVAERIIILIRNVLQIPTDPESERCTHDNPNSHDTVVYLLNQAGMLDILIYIAMTPDESHYYLHLLEIMMLMLKEQNPESLAGADSTRTATEKRRDEEELARIRGREVKERADRLFKYSSRHSRFGGTYVVKGVKGIGENDVLVHKPITNPEEITFNNETKKPIKKSARGAALRSTGAQFQHRSPLSVRIILRGFCEEFRGAYNNVMGAVRETIARERAQSNDETYYFWAVAFFMAFNRHAAPFQVHLISETMAVNIFHFLQVQVDTWLSNMTTEKKKIPFWSRRIHVALKAYKEMVMTLLAMVSSRDEGVRRSADTIQSNIFYVLEYRELVLVLFHAYAESKFSREYLQDLLETTHVFLKMLEHSCKHRKLVVQKQGRARKSKSRKNKKSAGKQSKSASAPLTFTDEEWNQMAPQLSAIMQHPELTLPPTTPFDGASDLSMDEQRLGAMSSMKSMLKKGQLELALSMLRSSREVWPENDVFGSMFCPPEEELLILREIYLTSVLQPKDMDEQPGGENAQDQSEEEDESEEDEEGEAVGSSYTEHSFEFIDFMKKFLNQNVTKALSHLLEQYDTNSEHTNHCLVKMMHRIAVDCKMPAMLYQASVFRVFQKVLSKEEPRLKELATFAKFIVRKFVAAAASNRHIFMELLFWKSTKDAYEIEEGYGEAGGKGGGAMRGAWQEHEEEELRRLFMEHEINGMKEEKVEWILDNLINKERTRKSVIKKLKELYLITSTKDLRPSLRPPTNWSEEEEAQLRTLYHEIKDLHDPMTALRDRMHHRRSKSSILNKLLELRIISHKAQMYKKRKKNTLGSSGFDDMGHPSSSSSSCSSSESDSESHQAAGGGGLTSSSLVTTIRGLLDSDQRPVVEWLKEALEETLADVDEDETDVPLVPVMAATQAGMQEEEVVAMLSGLGLKSPRENMEVYWRIPGVWNTNALKKRIDILNKLINNEDPTELPPITSYAMDTSRHVNESSDDENGIQNLRFSQSSENSNDVSQRRKEKKQKKSKKDGEKKDKRSKGNRDMNRSKSMKSQPSAAVDSDSSDFGDLELPNRSRSVNRGGNFSSDTEQQQIRVTSDSENDNSSFKNGHRDDELESVNVESDSNDANTRKSSQKTKRINLDSDSGSNEETTRKSSEKTKSINLDSDSDESGPGRKQSEKNKRINLDSDSENIRKEVKQLKSKKKRVVVAIDSSDSENEMEVDKNKPVLNSDVDDGIDASPKKTNKKKNRHVLDSDDDSNDTHTLKKSMDSSPQNVDIKKNKKRVLDSDSDGEMDLDKSKTVNLDTDNDLSPKKSTNDSQKKTNFKKNKSVLDSDTSDNEENIPPASNDTSTSKKTSRKKKRNVLDSDDSDSGAPSTDKKEKLKRKKKHTVELNSDSENESTEPNGFKMTVDSNLDDEKVSKRKSGKSKRKGAVVSGDENSDAPKNKTSSAKKSSKRKLTATLESNDEDVDIVVTKSKQRLSAIKQMTDDFIKKKMQENLYSSASDGESANDETNEPKISNDENPSEAKDNLKANEIVDFEDETHDKIEHSQEDSNKGLLHSGKDLNNISSENNHEPTEFATQSSDQQSQNTQENNSEIVNVSFKETITFDSEDPFADSETESKTDDQDDLTNETSKKYKVTKTESKNKTDKIISSSNGKTEIDEISDETEELRNDSRKEVTTVKDKHSSQMKIVEDSTENSSLVLNSQIAEKAKRPSEVYSDEETEDLVVKKVKRRRVIVEDDDD